MTNRVEQSIAGLVLWSLSLLTLPILWFCPYLAGAESSAALVGRWRSLETSKGGVGATYEFRRDGVVVFSPAAVVETTYVIEGSELVFPAGSKDEAAQRQRLDWLGNDRLRFGSVDASAGVELTRKGSAVDGKRSIVGEWAGTQDIDGRKVEVRYLFYPDRRALLLIPFLTHQGRYSTKGNSIMLEFPGLQASRAAFTISGNVLSITGASGERASRFSRY